MVHLLGSGSTREEVRAHAGGAGPRRGAGATRRGVRFPPRAPRRGRLRDAHRRRRATRPSRGGLVLRQRSPCRPATDRGAPRARWRSRARRAGLCTRRAARWPAAISPEPSARRSRRRLWRDRWRERTRARRPFLGREVARRLRPRSDVRRERTRAARSFRGGVLRGRLGRRHHRRCRGRRGRARWHRHASPRGSSQPAAWRIRALAAAALSLVRVGGVAEADRVLARAESMRAALHDDHAVADIGLGNARAARRTYAGNPAAYLVNMPAVIESATRLGDARTACLARAHLGYGHAAVGAWGRSRSDVAGSARGGEAPRLARGARIGAAQPRARERDTRRHRRRWSSAAAGARLGARAAQHTAGHGVPLVSCTQCANGRPAGDRPRARDAGPPERP